MKTIYCSPNFPIVTTMELDRPMVMSDYLLRRELKRLIDLEEVREAIYQVNDLLVLPERPISKSDVLTLMMASDEIYILLSETKGMMVEADEEMQEEYHQKTLYSFLIDLTNWLETR